MNFLIDTHAVIWFINDSNLLAKSANHFKPRQQMLC
jgi:PIN domain nuclease of toxin-antitoxin system